MVLNAAVQMIREAEELKQNILKFKSDTSMLQERSLWPSQQQLQKIYQKVLVLDLDYALDKKVEQDLWNVGFKQQIEALQTISKDRKNPLRGEAQAMLAWVLQAAAGFYLCLLHQICTAFKLDLPFRRRASLLGWVEGWRPHGPGASARLPPPAAARYICQHCLVHLGDLARYRQQPRVAYTFYRHALVVSTHSGQPYNQLALLARRRGRRLGALYWHVRAVLVRAPFPPAPANLLRTLQHASHNVRDQPVIPGVRRSVPAQAAPASRLDAHTHVTELMRAMCLIHTLEDLEFAGTLVNTLNTSLTALVATDCFESMTLIKMTCVIIWLVHSATEDLTLSSNVLSAAEATGAALSEALAAGALLALTLPAHTADQPPSRALPALKVYLQWAALYPQLLDSAPFQARPQIWHALAHTLNKLKGDSSEKYNSVPLPEDEELHGFQPLEESFKDLKFANHATWETYGRRFPDVDGDKGTDTDAAPPSVVSPACLNNDPEIEAAVRAHRLIKLGKRLAELRPEHFAYTTEGSVDTFEALCHGGEQLTQALAELQAAAAPRGPDDELDSEDDAPLPAPIVISEADFREKVRDKRVGILKPQGSLERAREERALATNDEQDSDAAADGFAGEDRRGFRRPRVNIAMAAILRKQEETCKQVKFKTPPPVTEETEIDSVTSETSTSTTLATTMDRPKPNPPRQPKSLADIPVGRKTGGILALKDKSGYPHLVDVPTETTQRQDKVQYKDPKVIQPPTQGQKREPQKWHHPYEHRPNKNYGLQQAGITYNPNYQHKTLDDHGIRLPVVNPKEIDVRSAALQKQNARVEYGVQKSDRSDKKSFLEDLPPRFANQKFLDQHTNRFRDDEFRLNSELMSAPPPSWLNPLTPPLSSRQSSIQAGALDTQLTMPPPISDNFSPRNWWKQNYPPPVTSTQTHSQALQHIYGGQLSYMPPYQLPPMARPDLPPSYGRPSPIGQQLPPRHIPPPNYNPYPPLPYPNMHENFPIYNRGFVEDRYQPQLEQGLDLTMNRATNLDLFVPTYDSRRADDGGLERAIDEALGGIPLDLSMKSDPEAEQQQQETPAPNPGTYSLFSGGPGTWGQVGPSQQSLWSAPKTLPSSELGDARYSRDSAH